MSSATNSDSNAIAEQFASITGSTAAVGKRLLELCNGDLQRAISMHLDGVIDVDAIENEGQSSASTSSSIGAPGPSIPPDDNVRAPIPSKMDTLMEEIPQFGPWPRQRRARQSVFDGLRDFQAETRIQEEMLSNPKSAAKKRTLEDLFRPPLDLMHKGTFVTAREAGQAQGKWLMVNVQNVREFSCQTLNRDVWSDTTVKSIIRESFIFWQVYHDSDEGQRYMQFYKVTDFPYVSILDPRTGEQMATWHRIDNEAFCDVVMQFLTDHKMDMPDIIPLSPPADSPSTAGPPKKKSRTDSIIDASEESQIEAAIAASLAEAEAAQSRSQDETPHTRSRVISIVSDSDTEDDDDDEEEEAVETIDSDFAFSDSESAKAEVSVVSEKPKPVNGATTAHQRTSVIVGNSVSNNVVTDGGCGSNSVARVDGKDKNGAKDVAVVETRTESDGQQAKSNGTSVDTKKSQLSNHESRKVEVSERTIAKDAKDAVDVEDDKKESDAPSNDKEEEEEDDDVADEASGPVAKIMLRFPDGKRKQVCLSASASLKTLTKRVSKEGFSEDKYELVMNFPRRKLSKIDSSTSLSDAGISHQESIFVQER